MPPSPCLPDRRHSMNGRGRGSGGRGSVGEYLGFPAALWNPAVLYLRAKPDWLRGAKTNCTSPNESSISELLKSFIASYDVLHARNLFWRRLKTHYQKEERKKTACALAAFTGFSKKCQMIRPPLFYVNDFTCSSFSARNGTRFHINLV